MKKLENFSWKMWHIFSLVAVTILLVGGIWSFFYLKEAAYVVNERNYDYVGRGQRLTDYVTIDEEEIGFPIIALSFKKDDKDWNSLDYAVGHQYLAFQDSKLFSGEEKKKDANQYFRIRYYKLGQEKGEGHTIDVLKLVQKMGYDTIEGNMRSTMFTDGKDEYVAFNVTKYNLLFVNLNKGEIAKTDPKMIVNFDYGGLYQILPIPTFETKKYSQDNSQTTVGLPWINYKYDEDEKVETSSSSTERLDRNGVKVKDSKLLTLLKKYRHFLILKQNLTMEEEKTVIKSLFPDADHFSWSISAPYTKSGQKEIIQNAEEFKKVIKEKRVEEELEREFEKTFQEGPDDD
ncbi:Uncharacterised protein [Streptococcus parasanguinis]|uniref:hypothetical protein n=1 Tax=Streptococcus parasanguinis TaxID=1318 RepID=UPI001960DC8B|nr:hypothetical protein [Streptococcus parasanguinis]VTY23074.1 Uncharacterised protein [Streptococcus parasanguinis]